jgi:cell wall-associated NlpC family hydrolase
MKKYTIRGKLFAVIGGKTYHFTGGKMDTGWKTIVNRTYYFHPNGVKQECGRVTIDGKVCAFGNNGVLSSRNSSISDVVRYAKKWEGKIPYKSSVTGNDKTDERKLELKEGRGSDCSWFVFHCLEKFGYLTEHVHSFEWGSKPSCYKGGKEIGKDLSKARPGDVICYRGHVAIYMGNGRIVHAADYKYGICISKNAAYMKILSIRRFF